MLFALALLLYHRNESSVVTDAVKIGIIFHPGDVGIGVLEAALKARETKMSLEASADYRKSLRRAVTGIGASVHSPSIQ